METKVNAIVLKTVDYGENDKILTLLTAERGKLSAGIKGVKKAGAKLKFAAQPFCFAEYVLARKGEKYTVIQASENESFYELREDVEKYFCACAVTEAAYALTYGGDKCTEIFSETIRALTSMCGGDEAFALVKYLVFLLSRSGYGIGLDGCSSCGAPLSGNAVRFDMEAGSFTCYDCGIGAGASLTTYNVLRAAAGKPYERNLFTDDGKLRALKLLREYLSRKADVKLLSLSEYINLSEI